MFDGGMERRNSDNISGNWNTINTVILGSGRENKSKKHFGIVGQFYE